MPLNINIVPKFPWEMQKINAFFCSTQHAYIVLQQEKKNRDMHHLSEHINFKFTGSLEHVNEYACNRCRYWYYNKPGAEWNLTTFPII